MVANAGTGEMNDGFDSGEGIEINGPGVGVPRRLIGRGGRASNEAEDVVSTGPQARHQS
jgi:hypothetical protein